ncbi:MAG: hypothetical protein HC799_16500 [Limnothrix sp. RL_2_0]|nr:hypothetical protein [Limnothrix sp. RL_2_0]
MTTEPTPQGTRNFLGIFSIMLGCFPMGVSVGIVQVDPATVHVPLWVLFACGEVFVMTGVMLIWGEKYPRFNHLCAAILTGSMGAIATWIAIFSDAAGFSGGIPFIPQDLNILIGRCFIGFGAVLSFLITVYAITQFFKKEP